MKSTKMFLDIHSQVSEIKLQIIQSNQPSSEKEIDFEKFNLSSRVVDSNSVIAKLDQKASQFRTSMFLKEESKIDFNWFKKEVADVRNQINNLETAPIIPQKKHLEVIELMMEEEADQDRCQRENLTSLAISSIDGVSEQIKANARRRKEDSFAISELVKKAEKRLDSL